MRGSVIHHLQKLRVCVLRKKSSLVFATAVAAAANAADTLAVFVLVGLFVVTTTTAADLSSLSSFSS